MTGRPFAGILLALLTVGPLLADDPKVELPKLPDPAKLPDVATFDKLVVDSLREVHNRGADLYNMSQNFEAAYRVYQGGLIVVRPLLAHRPVAQKMIEEGIANAEKELTPAKRAFKLHETIEAVRKSLKDANEPLIKPIIPEPEPKPKPKIKEPPIKPIPVEKAPTPHEKKLVEEKKPVEKKPKDPVEIKATDPNPMGVKAAGPSGKVTLKGQPLTAAEVTVVSLDQKLPRVFTAIIQAGGKYKFAEALPPGRYVVIVTAKNVPEKYQTTTTSGVVIEAGTGTYDIDLK